MPTPFPGMDPYLERPGLWEEVHAGLIVAIQQHLGALLRPRYRVAIERRTYLSCHLTICFMSSTIAPATIWPLIITVRLNRRLRRMMQRGRQRSRPCIHDRHARGNQRGGTPAQ